MLNFRRLILIVLAVIAASAFVVLANPNTTALIGQAKSGGIELKSSPDAMFAFEQAVLTFVPPDRVLATVGDTLYMLTSKHQVIWKETVGDVVGQPIVTSGSLIHVLLAQDKLHLVLDASTGKTMKCIDCHTTAKSGFTQMLPYKQNQYLVVESSAFSGQNKDFTNAPDTLTLWQGEQVVWSTVIPRAAQVRVAGDQILALEKKGEGIILREVIPPKK